MGFIDDKGNLVVPMRYCIGDESDFYSDRALVRDADSLLCGYIDLDGTPVTPLQYREAKEFVGDRAWVQSANERWGVIDKAGKVIVDFVHPDAGWFYFDQGRWLCSVIHPDDSASVFVEKKRRALIDESGDLLLPYTYDCAYHFHEGLSAAKVDGLQGYIDMNGDFVIKPEFKGVGNFSDGLASVTFGQRYRRPDSPYTGRLRVPGITPPTMDLDIPRPRVIDRTGTTVFEHDFLSVNEFSQGLARVESSRDGRFGFIDRTGAVVIEPRFKEVNYYDFMPSGVAIVAEKRLSILIDKNGDQVGKKGYADFFMGHSFDHTLFCVRDGKKWGFVNFRGECEIEPRFESEAKFVNGLAYVFEKVDGRLVYGYINRAGEYIYQADW